MLRDYTKNQQSLFVNYLKNNIAILINNINNLKPSHTLTIQ